MLTFAKACRGFKTKRIAAKTTRLLGKARFSVGVLCYYMEYSIGNVVLIGVRRMRCFLCERSERKYRAFGTLMLECPQIGRRQRG